MYIQKNTKYIIFALLTILNIVIRIPWTPHEIGTDSFIIHSIVNTISVFGEARWWIHPASLVGSYPYSVPSAVPFFLSGISQSVGIDTEITILLDSLILGLLSLFFAYVMAEAFWDNEIFKFFVAFIFSTSQGIVTYSTWTTNARTLFVIVLPLFLYVLLKTRSEYKSRYKLLTIIILGLLLFTHHYFYMVVPIIASYVGIVSLFKLNKIVRRIKPIRIPESITSIILFGTFLLLFTIFLFNRTFIEFDPIPLGSKYSVLLGVIKSYTRYVGFPIFIAVSGYIYLVFKQKKEFEELFLLILIAAFAPLLYYVTYMKWFTITFFSLLIGIGLTNLVSVNLRGIEKYRGQIIIVILVFSLLFTSYYQFLHFLNEPSPKTRFMTPSTYEAGHWIKDHVNKKMISEPFIRHRILSISEVPLLSGTGPSDISYGFVDPKKLEVEQIYKPTELGFYVHDPYRARNITTGWIADNIVTEFWARRLISKFNISYYVSNREISTGLDMQIGESDDRIFDNGKIGVWNLK